MRRTGNVSSPCVRFFREPTEPPLFFPATNQPPWMSRARQGASASLARANRRDKAARFSIEVSKGSAVALLPRRRSFFPRVGVTIIED